MRRDPRAGFSLIEMIIALSLASIVLIAVVGVAASMVRFHMEGMRKGSVTGGALVSFVKMAREIESANVLVYPSAATPNTDTLVVCNNWSRLMAPSPGAALDPAQPVEVFYYCYNPGAGVPQGKIWRYQTAGPCPTTPPPIPTCDGTAFADSTLMAYNVERLSGNLMFRRDTIGGVRIRYVVGEQAATEIHKVPIFIPFDLSLGLQKSYKTDAD